jgi:hypothetical protein
MTVAQANGNPNQLLLLFTAWIHRPTTVTTPTSGTRTQRLVPHAPALEHMHRVSMSQQQLLTGTHASTCQVHHLLPFVTVSSQGIMPHQPAFQVTGIGQDLFMFATQHTGSSKQGLICGLVPHTPAPRKDKHLLHHLESLQPSPAALFNHHCPSHLQFPATLNHQHMCHPAQLSRPMQHAQADRWAGKDTQSSWVRLPLCMTYCPC